MKRDDVISRLKGLEPAIRALGAAHLFLRWNGGVMKGKMVVLGLLLAAMAYFVFVVPKMEGTGTFVPRARQK